MTVNAFTLKLTFQAAAATGTANKPIKMALSDFEMVHLLLQRARSRA